MLALEGVVNPHHSAPLQERVSEIETNLRQRYLGMQRADLIALPAIQAFQAHYKPFGQTYHVLRQLESVALKGKPLASPSALVLAMFAAELQSLLLTAGHDLASLKTPIVLDASRGGEQFVGIGGREQLLRPGDMLMHDGQGIISAVIYGPDQRSQLAQSTRAALFTTYAPAEIGTEPVERHLEQIAELVRIVAPEATVSVRAIYP
jgi:DNA/RNA-binding domain of Phe-tRNA-synthetase-like protein